MLIGIAQSADIAEPHLAILQVVPNIRLAAPRDGSRFREELAEAVRVGDAPTVLRFPKGAVGEYQLQAAIAAVHDEAASADETDWPQILALYGLLERMSGNPMVTLNRAVAAAMVDGPAAGLALLEGLEAPRAFQLLESLTSDVVQLTD